MNGLNVRRGVIYYADLGEGRDNIQGGIRPVVVISNNRNNAYCNNIQIATLTSRMSKNNLPTHVLVYANDNNNLKCDSLILCETTTIISKSQLLQKIGFFKQETMDKVDKAVAIQLGLYNIDESFIEKLVFSVRKSKEMFDKYRDSELLSMYNGALYELKTYCEEHRVDYRKYYYEENNQNNIRTSQAV